MKKYPIPLSLLPVFFSAGCGSSITATDLASLIPSLGLSSPTARTSSASSSALREASEFSDSSGLVEGTPHVLAAADGETELKPLSDSKSEVSGVLTAVTADKCLEGFKMKSFSKNISCYGPTLNYANHANDSSSGQLPSGDLGIWSATEGTEGEACASAQMNVLVGDIAASVNSSLKLMAGLVCIAEVNGKAKPGISESIDLAKEMTTALPGATFTTASLKRVSDDATTSNPVFEMTVVGTVDSKDISLTLSHSPSSSGADFKGRLHGTHSVSATALRGFSVVYQQSGSTVKYLAKSAFTPKSSGTTALFDSSGNYTFTTFAAGGADNANARYALASMDKDTGLGTLYFAWQAGGMDVKSRVFQATTQVNAGAADSGFAYFGFGPKIDSASVGTIGGICCNWAGPGGTCIGNSSSYDISAKGQGQAFTRNSSGIFVPTTSYITYAPTNTCNYTAGTFKWGTSAQWGADGSSVTAASVTNNLVSLTTLGTIPTITEPN